jgi:hypothetical protein
MSVDIVQYATENHSSFFPLRLILRKNEFQWEIIFNEECRLLGYKNQGLTSQETHYISTDPSR